MLLDTYLYIVKWHVCVTFGILISRSYYTRGFWGDALFLACQAFGHDFHAALRFSPTCSACAFQPGAGAAQAPQVLRAWNTWRTGVTRLSIHVGCMTVSKEQHRFLFFCKICDNYWELCCCQGLLFLWRASRGETSQEQQVRFCGTWKVVYSHRFHRC